MFESWVTAGGNLIAMRPDPDLGGLLGLVDEGTDLSDAYLRIDTGAGRPGAGLVGQTIQFHGTADRYTPERRSRAARDAVFGRVDRHEQPGRHPSGGRLERRPGGGVHLRPREVGRLHPPGQSRVGRSGARRRATTDHPLGRHVLTRTGSTSDKIQIPQADEQQRLLANLIEHVNGDVMPLPRFWYFPRGEEAVVVMTGDDHASSGGTAGQFEWAKSVSPAACNVDDWECVRQTSYIYPNTGISDAAADGVRGGRIRDLDPRQHRLLGLDAQLARGLLRRTSSPTSRRTSRASPRRARSARTASPGATGRPSRRSSSTTASGSTRTTTTGRRRGSRTGPGYFTGSGMPMRFADLDGSLIDVYQAATQMPDESGLTYATHINTLLDNAIGAPGYYGVVTTNMHTDSADHRGTEGRRQRRACQGCPRRLGAPDADLARRAQRVFVRRTWPGTPARSRSRSRRAPASNGLQAMLPTQWRERLAPGPDARR